MNTRLINACIVGLSLSLLCVFAFGGTSSTVSTPSTVMHLEGQATVTLKDSPTLGTAHDQCLAKAKATPGKHTCSDVLGITTVADCADVKAPKVYLSKVTIGGKEYWDLPGASWTDDTYIEMADLYVHNSAWPLGVPNCWVKGRALRDDWRLNSKDEAGKVFMEHREPGMPAGDLIAEEPNSVEPVVLTAELDLAWHSPGSEEARHLNHICYDDDKTPCPPRPVIKPPVVDPAS